MSQHVVRRLRPYLFHGFERSQRLSRPRPFASSNVAAEQKSKDITHDYEKRVAQLEAYKPQSEWYPRVQDGPGRIHLRALRGVYAEDSRHREEDYQEKTEARKAHLEGKDLVVMGRVLSVRSSGSKLVFVDIKEGIQQVQIKFSFNDLEASDVDLPTFKTFAKTIRKGDTFSITGSPYLQGTGVVSIQATKLPTLMSPSLHQIPLELDDESTRAHRRHVDMLVNPAALQTLQLRGTVENSIHSFLQSRSFLHVRTPILQRGAGGAVARPFETEATELQGETLNLRIAPELWLKRLIVGGATRVYEMGPVFRNEGVDATHNPEFTICEFYKAHTSLESLIGETEELLCSIAHNVADKRDVFSALAIPDVNVAKPFRRLEFIPAIEKQLTQPLPDLSSPHARSELLELFDTHSLPVPAKPSLPRLLDALASHYLEPHCEEPTFITHHPAALSPLAKHFRCRTTGQMISARAELFIAGREMANMYEEENSPFAQREKFEAQIRYRQEVADDVGRDDDGEPTVDESYLAALEWGMPPTGGWGCGVDRLVMLFSGRERLGDVLAFGGLRNVVGVGRGR